LFDKPILFPSKRLSSPSIPLVKLLVIPVAALTRPPWTPALKASLDQPRPWSLSQVMALMALEAVGCAPSGFMLGKGRIHGDSLSCLNRNGGTLPPHFSINDI